MAGEAYRAFHARSVADREGFWAEQAKLVDWHRPFGKVLDYSRPPFAKWFVGGRTNLCHNAVDRHLATRGAQKALVYISTETDQYQRYTYRELLAEVNRFAAVLKAQEFVIPLIYRTQDIDTLREAVNALTAFGASIVPTMAKVLANAHEAPAIRLAIARVLGRLASPEALELITKHLEEPEIDVMVG